MTAVRALAVVPYAVDTPMVREVIGKTEGAPPIAAILRAAAERGELASADGTAAEIWRLVVDDRGRVGLGGAGRRGPARGARRDVSALAGRAALVTGAGSGIGAAIAAALVRAGARVCLVGRRSEALDATLATLPAGSAVACPGDVSVESDVARMVECAAGLADGRLHILVNNAGAPINGTIETASVEEWRRALDVNLTGPMLVTRYCASGHARRRWRSGHQRLVGGRARRQPAGSRPTRCPRRRCSR